MNYGLLSLLPPVVAVILAIWSKNVILSLFCGGFVGTMIFCGGNQFAAVHSMIGDCFFIQLTDSYNAGVLVLMVLIRIFKVMDFKDTFKIYVDGMKSMTDVAVTLVLTWPLRSMISGLGTANFIVEAMQSMQFSPVLVPAFIFLFGAFVSFATGSSWGTFAIMIWCPAGTKAADCRTLRRML